MSTPRKITPRIRARGVTIGHALGPIATLIPNSPLEPQLEAAYRRALYVVLDPEVVIRIGEPSAALDALLAGAGSAAFVTAANPGSERRSDEENRRVAAALRERVVVSRHDFLEGEGREPDGRWPAEPSLLVLGMPREAAVRLARDFAQNAFIWCERGMPPELVVVARWRLVLDTQVWLDWLAFDDPSVAPLKRAFAADRVEIYLDKACEAELERVLTYPIARRVSPPQLQAAQLATARRISRQPSLALGEDERATLPRCSDPDDQKFLELALAARAHALVTRDRALLALERRARFRIVPPAALDGF